MKLVLEVAHRPQAPDDERRARRAGEVGEQAVERADLDTRVLHRLPDEGHPLVEREQGLFADVHGHRHDHAVAEGARPADEILVAARDRIERAGVDRDAGHGA